VAAALGEHLLDGELGDAEKAGEVGAREGGVVIQGVFGEGLGEEDARVVDEGVDAAVAVDRSSDDAFGGGWVSDVALDGQDVLVVGGRDRARVGDDCLAELPVGVDQGGADALRGSSDDGDLLQRCLHSELLLPVRDEFPCQPARPMSIASLPLASRSAVMSGGRA
jgi:hypothetical protein